MSVLGGPRWILCEEAVLWLTVVGADGGGTRCAYMCGLPMLVPGGSHRIRCEEAVLQLTWWLEVMVEAVCVHVRPTYVGSSSGFLSPAPTWCRVAYL
jgi:hypothetical protein